MKPNHKPASFQGFTGSHLKWMALSSMFLDHIGAVLIENGLLPLISSGVFAGTSFQFLPADYTFWSTVNFLLRLMGRLAFPLYCFLLVEGFLATKNVKAYLLRLGLFALLSEVPFDLATHGKLFDLQSQNVFFTLFFGLLVLCGIKRLEYKYSERSVLPYFVIFAGMIITYFLQSDYDAFGILLIAMLYFLRESRKHQCLFGVICTLWEYSAPLAFLPVLFYNGKRGTQLPKWFFYGFYPIHFLLLFGLQYLLIYFLT